MCCMPFELLSTKILYAIVDGVLQHTRLMQRVLAAYACLALQCPV